MRSSASREYIALGIISLAAVGLAAGLLESGSPAFERYLGPIHPVLAIAVASALGALALRLLLRRYGFGILAPQKTLRGMTRSAAIATLFAAGVIAVDLALGYPEGINVPLPQSLLFYPVIGYGVELLFHVVALALLLTLLRPLKRSIGLDRLVWLCIVLAAALEPILQVIWAGGLAWTELYTGLSVFVFGVVQMALFRRYDFVTMLSLRLFYYLIWHIAWGYVRLGVLF